MTPADRPSTLHFFVDEAGDPTLFDAKGRILVGQDGCSKTFIVGKLDVGDPAALQRALAQLRADLLADPYFKRVPSMQPERGKTALAFHAKDDVAEVRREVFKVLVGLDLRFYAVVRHKAALLDYVRQRNEREPGYRYRGDELYDTLVEGKRSANPIFPADPEPANLVSTAMTRGRSGFGSATAGAVFGAGGGLSGVGLEGYGMGCGPRG